jgi:predicted Zn-dependent protease
MGESAMMIGLPARRLVLGLAMAGVLGAPVHAQVPRGLNPAAAETARESAKVNNAGLYQAAQEALQARNFPVAEAALRDLVRADRLNPELNLMLGIALMGQERWADARQPLETAVRKAPKSPDARSRLAVTYLKLGETIQAEAQRAELVKLSDRCKGTCRDAQWIASGIAMVDGTVGPALPPASPQ